MDLVKVEDESSVAVFYLRMSEGELQSLAEAAEYAKTHLTSMDLVEAFTSEDTREFETPDSVREILDGIYIQLMDFIRLYCRPELLPKRFRDWVPSQKSVEEQEERRG